jgi:hypothetical protein
MISIGPRVMELMYAQFLIYSEKPLASQMKFAKNFGKFGHFVNTLISKKSVIPAEAGIQ